MHRSSVRRCGLAVACLAGAARGGWLGYEYEDVGGLELAVSAGETAKDATDRFCAQRWLSSKECAQLHAQIPGRHVCPASLPSPYSFKHVVAAPNLGCLERQVHL